MVPPSLRRRLPLLLQGISIVLLYLYLSPRITSPPSALTRSNANRSNVIVSLTSTPARFTTELPKTIWSLIHQTHVPSSIEVYFPLQYQTEISTILDSEEQLGHDSILLHPLVKIQFVNDEGPATKFLPALRSLYILAAETEGEEAKGRVLRQPLLVVDDDHLYSPGLVETLLASYEKGPGRVVGMRGWRVRRDLVWGVIHAEYSRHVVLAWDLAADYQVGVVTANEVSSPISSSRPPPEPVTQGYLITPLHFLPSSILTLPPPSSYLPLAPLLFPAPSETTHLVDDIWLSGHLALLSLPRFVVPLRSSFPPSIDITTALASHRTLERRLEKEGVGRKAANEMALKWFMGGWRNAWDEGIWYEVGGEKGWQGEGWCDYARRWRAKREWWRCIRETFADTVVENR